MSSGLQLAWKFHQPLGLLLSGQATLLIFNMRVHIGSHDLLEVLKD